MPDPARILVVVNRVEPGARLLEAVRARAARGPAAFHLVVSAHPHGLHKVVDPQEGDRGEARHVLEDALPRLTTAAGSPVTGHVGDAEPLMAIEDALNRAHYDEIIISTRSRRLARLLHLDLVSKARGEGLPVTHVEARRAEEAPVA